MKEELLMEVSERLAVLERENAELRAEREILFNTVLQLKSSLDLLIRRYMLPEKK